MQRYYLLSTPSTVTTVSSALEGGTFLYWAEAHEGGGGKTDDQIGERQKKE
jgi:hypothetical protein